MRTSEGLRSNRPRRDGSTERRKTEQLLHRGQGCRSARHCRSWQMIASSSSTRHGGQWCRPGLATTDVAVFRLRTVIPASGCTVFYQYCTIPLLHEAVQVLAGCVQLVPGAPCGRVAVEYPAASRLSHPGLPRRSPGTSSTTLSSCEHVLQASQGMCTVKKMLST